MIILTRLNPLLSDIDIVLHQSSILNLTIVQRKPHRKLTEQTVALLARPTRSHNPVTPETVSPDYRARTKEEKESGRGFSLLVLMKRAEPWGGMKHELDKSLAWTLSGFQNPSRRFLAPCFATRTSPCRREPDERLSFRPGLTDSGVLADQCYKIASSFGPLWFRADQSEFFFVLVERGQVFRGS